MARRIRHEMSLLGRKLGESLRTWHRLVVVGPGLAAVHAVDGHQGLGLRRPLALDKARARSQGIIVRVRLPGRGGRRACGRWPPRTGLAAPVRVGQGPGAFPCRQAFQSGARLTAALAVGHRRPTSSRPALHSLCFPGRVQSEFLEWILPQLWAQPKFEPSPNANWTKTWGRAARERNTIRH